MRSATKPVIIIFSLLTAAAAGIGIRQSAATEVAAPPVALIGATPVSMQELTERTAAHLADQQRSYEKSLKQAERTHERDQHAYREQELQALIDERVLALEAKARKTTVAALTGAVQAAPITAADAKAFYETNKAQINQPFEQIEPMIKQFMAKQAADAAKRAYLTTLRTKYKASVTLEPYRESVAAEGPARGPDNAPVTIVEFSDFQCPFCGRYSPVVKEVLDQYPTSVRLVYRHLPLTSLHPNAQHAAEAAVCAQRQGKFWELHDLLFAEQKALDPAALKEKAGKAGLDSKSFDDCLASGKAGDVIKRDVEAAEQLGLAGTPASFVNGRFLNGAVPKSELVAVIEDELRRAGRPVGR